MKTAIAGSFAVLLFCAALFIFVLGGMQTWKARASKTWPVTTGQITYAATESGGSGTNYKQTPVVKYRYDVEGQDYRAERIAFGPTPSEGGSKPVFTTDRRDRIMRFAQRNAGEAVDVYYNPRSPDEAVLLPGGGLFLLIYLFAVALCAGMSFICWLIASGRVKT
ncbi:DUF3592 domain-containing protein [Yoonia sp. 2307UL14-13]|uniref:DUF3592 domain-containing protein n=1 Tax=Yoonia sp. 2307UL14-13 TaxID=3126506 RepID=UPI0030A671DF